MNPRTWVKGKKLMTLKGEVRFLSGEPFRGRLAVGGTAAGFDPAAPNINVVLWTGERDAVTANLGGRGIDLRRWRDADGTLPADYFLVGMGYRLPGELEALLENDRGRNFPGGLQNLLPAYLRDTTHVVLAGDRGRSLHADRRELIWQSGLPGKLPGPARFQVSMDGGTLLWSVNRKVMSLADSLVLDRLKAKVPHSGSFSLLTNGREVHYAAFEVKGDLDPAWVRQRARAQAEKELAALTGAAGAAAAPPAETAEKKS
jgi:hypothetical protein